MPILSMLVSMKLQKSRNEGNQYVTCLHSPVVLLRFKSQTCFPKNSLEVKLIVIKGQS